MPDLPPIALSIRQPWAWAILHAGKRIENRKWPTSFRGTVCIHAAKGMTKAEVADFSAFLGELRLDGVIDPFVKGPHYRSLPRGGIVGVAEIRGCVNRSDNAWFSGPWGFILDNVRPVEFVPCAGALGFFGWKPSTEKGLL